MRQEILATTIFCRAMFFGKRAREEIRSGRARFVGRALI